MDYCIGKFVSQMFVSDSLRINEDARMKFITEKFVIVEPQPSFQASKEDKTRIVMFPSVQSTEYHQQSRVSRVGRISNTTKAYPTSFYYGELIHENAQFWTPLLEQELIRMTGSAITSHVPPDVKFMPIQVTVFMTAKNFGILYDETVRHRFKNDQDLQIKFRQRFMFNGIFQLMLLKSDQESKITRQAISLYNDFLQDYKRDPLEKQPQYDYQQPICLDVTENPQYYIDVKLDQLKNNKYWPSKEKEKHLIYKKSNGDYVSLWMLMQRYGTKIKEAYSQSQFQQLCDSLNEFHEKVDFEIREEDFPIHQFRIEQNKYKQKIVTLISLVIDYNPFQSLNLNDLGINQIKEQIQIMLKQRLNTFQRQIFEKNILEIRDTTNLLFASKNKQFQYQLSQIEEDIMFQRQVIQKNLFNEQKLSQFYQLFDCLKTEPSTLQLQALNYILEKEGKRKYHYQTEQSPFRLKYQLPYLDQSFYYNVLTCQVQKRLYDSESVKGGIIGGSPGSGKTLVAIALLCMEKLQKNKKGVNESHKKKYKTLLLIKSQDIAYWIQEIKQHISPDFIDFYVTNDHKDLISINFIDFDLVITTYEFLMEDKFIQESESSSSDDGSLFEDSLSSNPSELQERPVKKRLVKIRQPTIFNRYWRRIIIDEPQVFATSENFMNVLISISAKYKWILSGQPDQSKLQTFQLMIKFLRLEPLNFDFWFNLHFRTKEYSPESLFILNEFLREYYFTLNIPNPVIIRKSIKYNLNQFERQLYNSISSKDPTIYAAIKGKKVEIDQFLIYNYLRMVCNHPFLIYRKFGMSQQFSDHSFMIKLLDFFTGGNQASLKEFQKRQTEILKDYKFQPCLICLTECVNVAVAPCGHATCQPCFFNVVFSSNSRCPLCKAEVNLNQLLLHQDEEQILPQSSSSKLESLKEQINLIRQKFPKDKLVIATLQRAMMKIITAILDENSIPYATLGKKTVRQEIDMISQKFRDFDGFMVLQIQLKSLVQNLDLSSANHLVIFDTWWNNKYEERIISKIQRIGQTKQVFIYSFQGVDTVEEVFHSRQKQLERLICI